MVLDLVFLADKTCYLSRDNMINGEDTHKRQRKNTAGIFRKGLIDLVATIVDLTLTFPLILFH